MSATLAIATQMLQSGITILTTTEISTQTAMLTCVHYNYIWWTRCYSESTRSNLY